MRRPIHLCGVIGWERVEGVGTNVDTCSAGPEEEDEEVTEFTESRWWQRMCRIWGKDLISWLVYTCQRASTWGRGGGGIRNTIYRKQLPSAAL